MSGAGAGRIGVGASAWAKSARPMARTAAIISVGFIVILNIGLKGELSISRAPANRIGAGSRETSRPW